MFTRSSFSPEQVELMKAAFDAAWKFVEVDATLASVALSERRLALAQALMALISQGEQDAFTLGNEAIALVRRIHAPSPRVRIRHKGASMPAPPPAGSMAPVPDTSPRPRDTQPRPGAPRHRSHRH